MFCGGRNNKHRASLAVIAAAPTSAEHPIAVLPQDLKATIRIETVRQDGLICRAPSPGF